MSRSSLKDEAIWAFNLAKAEGMIGPSDTSVIFHSWDTHRRYLTHLSRAFSSHPRSLHAVAIKTNPHSSILKQVVEWGFGLEAASMEEVWLAVNSGCPFHRIVFDSPVKTRREINTCHTKLHGIILNMNTLEELHRLPPSPNVVVGLRINPLVNTGAPSIFNVSSNESKFGVPITQKQAIIEAIIRFPITQLHVHSGTAMVDLGSAVMAIKSIVELATRANEKLNLLGIDRRIDSIDIGGGLSPEILSLSHSSQMELYAHALMTTCPDLLDFKLVTEFGQWSYFYSGFAHSQIEYAVKRGETRIAFIHLGADFLLRDIYKSKRDIEFVPIGKAANREKTLTDIAGPLCFEGDYVQKSLMLPKLEEGDDLLLLNTGSNAFGLWSRHCSRTIPQVIGFSKDEQILTCLSQRFNPFLQNAFIETKGNSAT